MSEEAAPILRQVIWEALDHDLLDSAAFNAERLVALDPHNPDSKHLEALVLYRQRRYAAAANKVNGINHIGCIYVYAQACLQLDMATEGITALEKTRPLWESCPNITIRASDTHRSVIPDAKIINILLGKLYERRKDIKDAAKAYAASARVNPYLWTNVERLCKFGVNLNLSSLFGNDIFEKQDTPDDGSKYNDQDNLFRSQHDLSDPFRTPVSMNSRKPPTKPSFTEETPTASQTSLLKRTFRTPVNSAPNFNNGTPSTAQRTTTSIPLAPQKRSSRNIANLSALAAPSDKPALPTLDFALPSSRRTTRASARRTATGDRLLKGPIKNGSAANDMSNDGGKTYLIYLYRNLTRGLYAFYKYQCKSSLAVFNSLPEEQLDTPWVQAKIGRLYFEMVDYKAAKRSFTRLRELDRCRVEDMEYFSTLLWHLKNESELSYLAHELLDIDRTAYQSWCALGNTFSLMRQTDKSLKCFRRAIQLSGDAAYAYTLQAHELISNDSFEEAKTSFESAIRADRLHYNAWYGLGMVYMRLGNMAEAETHFTRAAAINACNVVLICCIGMIYEKKGRYAEALEHYKRACDIQPQSALSRYRKARALINLKLYNAALIEFGHLVKLAPDEARVHFLLAQLYKTLSNRELAVKHFTFALNLDPKGSHLIKEALEALSAH